MAEAVYVLCTFTSAACAGLLFRAFREKRARMLLWSGICFAGLFVNNLLLLVDLVFVPSVDLSVPRAAVAVLSVMMMLFGLIWESR